MIPPAEILTVELINHNLEEIEPESPDFSSLLNRIGDAEIVLLGESTHGTSEFYDLRADITMELIREKGFEIVLLEADWPDTEGVNQYVQGRVPRWHAFRRFPEWMWRNLSFAIFVERLKAYNLSFEARSRVSIYGMDLYSLSASLEALKPFIKKHLPDRYMILETADTCLRPWYFDHSHYGLAVLRGVAESCESEVADLFKLLYENESRLPSANAELFSAFQNARVVKNAEEYYRTMHEGSIRSWNLRDQHMFETLKILKEHFNAKIVVWAHNSHIGNAAATEMGQLGEINIGQLCKAKYGDKTYAIGFMTDHGTVTAANYWDGPAETKALIRARPDSYEMLFHMASSRCYLLPLQKDPALKKALSKTRLERAVGVIYRPDTERLSHYFEAGLGDQFDEIFWVDETSAVVPLPHAKHIAEPDTYPFGY